MALNFDAPPTGGPTSALGMMLSVPGPGMGPDVPPQPGFPAGEPVLPAYLGPPPGQS
jgi:hypothetical protein